MITSQTDFVVDKITLDVHGAKLLLTPQECREIIVTLSHAVLPIDDETIRLIYKRIMDEEFERRRAQ